jgi:hypothetical protein
MVPTGHALVSRWRKAVEVDGILVEKQGLETNLLTRICIILMNFNKFYCGNKTWVLFSEKPS